MASRRGVAVTGIVLAAITGASFLVWLVPGGNQATFVVTDHEGYLDGAAGIGEVLRESVELDYAELLDGSLEPAEYDARARATSSQVTEQIAEFVTSKPPEEWQASYIGHMEAMRKLNEYIRETMVVSSVIAGGGGGVDEAADRAGALADEAAELARAAEAARP